MQRIPGAIAGLVLAGSVGTAQAQAPQSPQVFTTAKARVAVETIAQGLEFPWSLAFLPDGRMLVTERPGRLRIVGADGRPSEPIRGLPRVAARGQGGLLDVALDPDFNRTRLVFLSYAEDRRDGRSGTSVLKARLNEAGTALESPQVIFRQEPSHTGGNHYGSRLVFDREGHLFITLGERFDLRDQAQNPTNHLGKIVHITVDGRPAEGSAAFSQQGARPEIWSIGHRNIQGAALHPTTGALWTVEHGARGGDEVNIPQRGKNYGWPVITYGVDYSGAKIGEGTAKAGMEQPVYYWDPSIAPSGMTFYTGDKFPAWRGSVLVGALAGRLISRLETNGPTITGEERMLQGLRERIRDVRQGPDGFVYLLTDSAQGRILRLTPAS